MRRKYVIVVKFGHKKLKYRDKEKLSGIQPKNKALHTKGAKRDASNCAEVWAHPSADHGCGELLCNL